MRRPDTTLEYLLGARTRTILIERLMLHPQERPWFRELCRGINVGMSSVHWELDRLCGLGLVTRKREGGACFYLVNTEHVLYEPLRALAVAARAHDERIQRPSSATRIGRFRMDR